MNTKWTNQELSPQRGATERNTPATRRTLGKDIMILVNKIDGKVDSFWEKHLPQSEIAKKRRKDAEKAVAVLALSGLAVFGINETINNKSDNLSETTVLGEKMFSVPENGTVIDSAVEAVEDMAVQYNVDLSEIPFDDVTYESQDAATSTKGQHNRNVILPGDSFVVTLSEVGKGYEVSVDPIELPSNW